jgi:Flp pilus assembly protein TadD
MTNVSLFILSVILVTNTWAWRPFGEPSDGKIRPAQALSDSGKSRETLALLTPAFLQTLRGTDLRQAYILIGDNLRKLGHRDEALGYYQIGVSLFPKNVDLLVRQAILLHNEGLDDQAKPLFARILKIEPRHWNAHQGLAEIDRQTGFLDRAAAHYEIALESIAQRADIWRDYAEVLLELREFRTADLAIHKALELEPKSPESRIILAFAQRSQGDLDSAIDELDTAILLGAGIGAKRAKALFLLESKKWEEAVTVAHSILKEIPDDGVGRWVMARVRLSRGKDKDTSKIAPLIPNQMAQISFSDQALQAFTLEVGKQTPSEKK